MSKLRESELEQVCLEWFADLGYEVLEAHNFDPAEPYEERESVFDVVIKGRLEEALRHLNPDVPEEALQQAIRELTRADAPTLVQNNEDFHRRLTDGVEVEVSAGDGQIRGVRVRVVDFDDPAENNWMIAQQLTVVDSASGTGVERRVDLVVYLNGLPVGVIELKNPTGENADVWSAYRQLQTYKRDIPSLFVSNCVLVISDDVEARIGSLTAPESRFGPWRTIDGDDEAPRTVQPLEVLVRGVFDQERFLDLVQNFITFEVERDQIIKKVAAYHQFHAVRTALDATVRASSTDGDGRIGVVWHTQGSGKSLSMLFYARKLVLSPEMANPTIVVLTDRNDLDNQLFSTFSRGQALLRQEPNQAADRAELRDLLQTESGGVYFTTMQKFLPEPGKSYPALSERRNIVVIADEAHRSHYGLKGRLDTRSGELVYGYAKHLRDALPNAAFVGFTGTPVDLEDRSTRRVFGDDISVYDIKQAVEDGATVPIYYENRLAKIELDETEKPQIDPKFDEITEDEEEARREALKSKWSALEKVAGTDKRLALIAADLVAHYETRTEAIEGKALIVCMSRRICAHLYEAICKLRPEWHSDDDDAGAIKVVMTGSASDEALLQPHVRSKSRRERLADRFRDPDDPLRLVIVRDMWLTGFDAPCLHTLYVDKPMRGHNLMQAIARVNRVFRDKPGGLVVDYIGIFPLLEEAMSTYTKSGGKGDPTELQAKAVTLMLEQLEICRDLFHGFDYSVFFTGEPRERLALLPAAREHVLAKRQPAGDGENKKDKEPDDFDRFIEAVTKLTKAFALAAPHESCEAIRDEVAFFQAVKVGLVKLTKPSGPRGRDLDQAIRQIVSNAIVSDEVVDLFGAAGLERPDISIFSEEFLDEIRHIEHKNLAIELLNRLLRGEVSARSRRSVIQKRSFQELLERAIRKYQNRSVQTVQVIEELIELARKIRDANKKGEELGLNNDEFHFYEALAANDSAVDVLGDDALAKIAQGLTQMVRKNANIDWQHRANLQAKLRLMVKKELKKQGYPPDQCDEATNTVLEQAKMLGINFIEGGAAPEPEANGPAPPKPPGPLPYPIAVFDSLVAAQENAALRVKTRVDGIEKALAFIVATELAFLRDANGGTMPDNVLAILGDNYGKPVAFGTWLDYSWKLAGLIPANAGDPIARAARSFVSDAGKPSELTKELQSVVVPYRNKFSHGVTPNEQAVTSYEKPLHAIWERLKAGLAPLGDAELVVRSKGLDFDGDDYNYSLRILQGPSDHFRLEQRTLSEKLQGDWCYLLRDGRPLLLAPIVLCTFREEVGRNEVFLARSLGKSPGAKIDVMAVTSSETMKVALP